MNSAIYKTLNYIKKNGVKPTAETIYERLTQAYDKNYSYEFPSAVEVSAQRETSCVWEKPCFSILVPCYETDNGFLVKLLDALAKQTYGGWEVILADASKTSKVESTVKAYLKANPGMAGHSWQQGEDRGEDAFQKGKVHYLKLTSNEGISENTNAALPYAKGDWIGLLDHDDFLTEDAVFEMADAIRIYQEETGTEPAFCYSDEDKYDPDSDTYFEPNHKPDFNRDFLLSNNYICHFLVMHRDLFAKLLLRREYDGAQDFDLVLRASDHGKVLHISKVLYHWTCHKSSTAANPASKLYAYEAGKRAVADYLRTHDIQAEVEHTRHLGFYEVVYQGDLFLQRKDIAAYGGSLLKRGKIISGLLTVEGTCPYAGLRSFFSGPGNKASVMQNAQVLDARVITLRAEDAHLYEEMIGLDYIPDVQTRLRTYGKTLSEEEWILRSRRLSAELTKEGKLLLWIPAIQNSL